MGIIFDREGELFEVVLHPRTKKPSLQFKEATMPKKVQKKQQIEMPLPDRRNVIRLSAVQRILDLRGDLAVAKQNLERITNLLNPLESIVIEDLEMGLPPEEGCPPMAVHREERRTPKYKEAYLRVAGTEALENLIMSTPPSISKTLVITQMKGK